MSKIAVLLNTRIKWFEKVIAGQCFSSLLCTFDFTWKAMQWLSHISKRLFFHVLPYIKRHFFCLKFNITHLHESACDFHEVLLNVFRIHEPEMSYDSLFISHYVRHFDEIRFVKHSRSNLSWVIHLECLFSRLSSSGEFNIMRSFMKVVMKLFFAGVVFHESFHEKIFECLMFHETLTFFSWKSFLINTSFFSSNCFERISIFYSISLYTLNKCISILRNIKLERNQYIFTTWYVSNDTLFIWVC